MIKIKSKLLEQLKYLSETYDALGEVYKSKAYYNVYVRLKKMKEEGEELPEGKEMMKIKGIGKSIYSNITDFYKTGYIKEYKEFHKDKKIKKIMDLTKVHGFGIKKAKDLFSSGYKSIDELKTAYLHNKLKLTTAQILGLQYFEDLEKKIPKKEIDIFNKEMKKLNQEMEVLGSYRRGKKLSGDIDLLIKGNSLNIKKEVMNHLNKNFLIVDEFYNKKIKSKFMGLILIDKTVRHLDIIFSDEDEYVFKKLYFTGSKEHNIKMRNVAIKKGYKLSDKGLFKGSKKINLKTEKDIFEYLGMKYVKPEDR